VRGPHFCGDEHLVAGNAGAAQSLAHFQLIVVHLGGIDMAIAEAQRLRDETRAAFPAQFPCAEPDGWNVRGTNGWDHHDNLGYVIDSENIDCTGGRTGLFQIRIIQ
jgi:hypothetical protein